MRKAQRDSCVVRTTRKKIKNGRATYSGTKFLKGTQCNAQLWKMQCSAKLSKHGLMSPTLGYGTVLLRSYPVPFGLCVLRCFPDFCRDAARPHVAEPEDAPQLFHSTEVGDTWPEADLISACVYLRGSKHLRVSERWKAAFPTSMWAESPSFLVP